MMSVIFLQSIIRGSSTASQFASLQRGLVTDRYPSIANSNTLRQYGTTAHLHESGLDEHDSASIQSVRMRPVSSYTPSPLLVTSPYRDTYSGDSRQSYTSGHTGPAYRGTPTDSRDFRVYRDTPEYGRRDNYPAHSNGNAAAYSSASVRTVGAPAAGANHYIPSDMVRPSSSIYGSSASSQVRPAYSAASDVRYGHRNDPSSYKGSVTSLQPQQGYSSDGGYSSTRGAESTGSAQQYDQVCLSKKMNKCMRV